MNSAEFRSLFLIVINCVQIIISSNDIFQCPTCGLICDDNIENTLSHFNIVHTCQGTMGEVGPVGLKGEQGNPGPHGVSCDCDDFNELQSQLEHLHEDLLEYKKYSKTEFFEWKEAQNGLWYRLSQDQLPFERARSTCLAENARLASTGIRNHTIRKEILVGIPPLALYVGFDDIKEEGEWVWSDGVHEAKRRKDTLWRYNELNNIGGNEDCAQMYIVRQSTGDVVLNDVPCWVPTRYVCEYEP
ncbi:collectin-11-like [Styela clava]